MKKKALIILIFFFVIGVLMNTYYREYIYENNKFDFGIADVGYNLVAVILMTLTSFIGLFKITNNKVLDVLIFTLSYITNEIFSYFFPILGTFDFKDIIALLLSGLIAIGLLHLFDKNIFLNRKKVIKYFEDE